MIESCYVLKLNNNKTLIVSIPQYIFEYKGNLDVKEADNWFDIEVARKHYPDAKDLTGSVKRGKLKWLTR